MDVKSRMLEGESVPVIIVLKDQPSIKALSKDNAISSMKSLASSRQKSIASILKEEISKGKANKIKQLWIVNAIAAEASPELIMRLAKRDDVARIELDAELHIMNDLSAQFSQGQIDNATSEIKRINASKVWELGIDGSGINVSVIDTGINASHPDIAGRVIKWVDYVGNQSSARDDNGHGTHVAGTVGGNGSRGTTTGVAPNVSLFGVKVLNSTGVGFESDVLKGIQWSIENNAHIISMSLGSGLWTTSNCDADEPAMASAINNAVGSGAVVVAAAGNNAGGVSSPGCIQYTISVGAVNNSDNITYFSGRGGAMGDHGVVAPGVTIYSLRHDSSGYRTDSGTSMATPHVSGTIALLLQAANRLGTPLSPSQMKSILETTSVDLGTAGKDNTFGSGRLDVFAAVKSLDTDPPAVIANPALYSGGNPAARIGENITLSATIIDIGFGVKNATVNISSINASLANINLNNISGFWMNNSVIVNVSSGIYSLHITAYDNVSNINNTVQFTVKVDNTPPLVTVNPTGYPDGDTAAQNGTVIILNATITDSVSGVKNATLNVSSINASLTNISLSNSSGFWTNNGIIVYASDGIYYLNITAYDNMSYVNNSIQLSVTVDNTLPLVYINQTSYQHGNAANNRSIIWFGVSADDPRINGTSSGLKNASVNASLINNTEWIELTNQSYIWRGNATIDKFITDGNYSLNVTFFDNAGNINDSVQISVSIDNTPPSIGDVSVSSQFINATGFTNISANITSLDAMSQVNQSEVFARITYPNGTSINYGMNGGDDSLFFYNFTDTAQYGRFNVTILANDTTGNINSAQRIQFVTAFITNNVSVVTQANSSTVVNAPLSNTTLYLFTNNTSAGTINITQSKINITSNELNITNPGIYVNVSASSSIRNNLSYVLIYVNYTDVEVSSYIESSLRLYRWNTNSSSWDRLTGAGLFPYVNDAGVDTANNFVWANLTELSEFAVSGELYVSPPQTISSGSGGGGGGGGGGGTSGENYSNIESKEKRDMYIFKDRVTSYKFDNNSPILYVNITGNVSAGEITTTVEVLRNISPIVKSYSVPGIVYKNLNIWVGTSGFATPKNIQKGVIRFRVQNMWLKSSGVTENDVRMVKWNGMTWLMIETIKRTEGSEYTYYEAYTDSFSPFAITAFRSDAVPVEAIKTSVMDKTPAPEETKIKQKETPEPNGGLLVTVAVFFIIVAILAVVYLREKKKY